MTGAQNTQASEFPADPDILASGPTQGDEFRDIDLVSTAGTKPTTDYSSVPNESMRAPREMTKVNESERRVYANGPDAVSVARVSDEGTRRYGAFSVNAFPGTGGYAGAPVLLLGEDRSRVRVVISNGHDLDAVRIGPLDSIVNGGGLALPIGVLFETMITEPIYACVPVGGTNVVPLGVWAEYA